MPLQPYQIFFPLGLMHALAGSVVWVLYWLGVIRYPGASHAHWMITGFLFSFATGFLMTAVPRMLGTIPARPFEMKFALALNLLTLALGLEPVPGWLRQAAPLLTIGFIASFISTRVRERSFDRPPYFRFVALALACGAAGSLLLMLTGTGLLATRFAPPARTMLYHGTMLCLALGVGGKLLRNLMGWSRAGIASCAQGGGEASEPLLPTAGVSLLMVSFVLDFLDQATMARLLRASTVTVIAIHEWRLFRRPAVKTRTALWLWVSIWALVLGLWSAFFFRGYEVHAAHLIFISGFGVLTLTVASRVVLAHGGYDMTLEQKLPAYHWFGALLLIAALTRVSAPLLPIAYASHIAYAAIAWMLGIAVWTVTFFPKTIGRGYVCD